MTVPTTIGVVGTGWRADFFVRLARLLPEEVTLVGAAVRRAEAAESVSSRWSVPVYLSPADLVAFRRVGAADRPLAPGDELDVDIRWAGACRVRVVSREKQSITLATLSGHPEAGRITFGAYRNDYRDVVFHIRSRARSGSWAHHVGFLTAGEAMQTNTWTDFVQAVAYTFGGGIIGCVHADIRRMRQSEEPATDETACSPTFRAEGD